MKAPDTSDGQASPISPAISKLLFKQVRFSHLVKVSIALVLVIWVTAFAFVSYEKQQEINELEKQSKRLAIFFEEQTHQIFEYADAYAKSVRREYIQNQDLNAVEQYLADVPINKNVVSHITIFNKSGRPIFNSSKKKMKAGSSAKDRDYFKRTMALVGDGLYISKAVMGRNTGKVTIRLVRPVDTPDGERIGVMFAAITDAKIVGFLKTIKFWPNSSATLVGLDHIVRARSSYGSSGHGQKISDSRLWTELTKKPVGYYKETSVVDGILRNYAYRKLMDYPVIVTIGVSEDALATRLFGFQIGTYGAALFMTISFGFLLLRINRENAIAVEISNARDLLEVRVEQRTTELKESEEKFRSIYEIMPDVLMITNVQTGECIDVNEGFSEVTGYSRAEVIGHSTTSLMLWEHADDRRRLVQGLTENGTVFNLTANFRRKDGTLWPGLMSARLFDYEGVPQMLSLTKDVTEIRRAEQEAIDANKAKSEFLSSMSHELRTPMNAIMGFAQMLDYNPQEPLTETQKASVGHILTGSSHLLDLINQVLELNKIEAGKASLNIDHISARGVIDKSIVMMEDKAAKAGITITDKTTEHDLPILWTDATRLHQVLLNLLSNAVKYNQKGGEVTISSEDVPGQMLRIMIADTGDGISEERHEDLFLPFERLGREAGNIEGTGIGLTITKQLVELLGGEINFESKETVGSTFWVDIPISHKKLDDEKKIRETSKKTKQIKSESNHIVPQTILYIEDNPDNIRLMETVIGHVANCKLLTAHNAELGLDIAKSEKPGLILMDINLPGMNGIEALKLIQDTTATSHIPVIAVTAAAMSKDIEAGMKAGFTGYMTKPFIISELIKTIENTLNSEATSL